MRVSRLRVKLVPGLSTLTLRLRRHGLPQHKPSKQRLVYLTYWLTTPAFHPTTTSRTLTLQTGAPSTRWLSKVWPSAATPACRCSSAQAPRPSSTSHQWPASSGQPTTCLMARQKRASITSRSPSPCSAPAKTTRFAVTLSTLVRLTRPFSMRTKHSTVTLQSRCGRRPSRSNALVNRRYPSG